MNPYETRQYLKEYLLLHYGSPAELCPYPFAPREALQFHRRIIQKCLLPVRFPEPTRGLDIGCAVGRLTFELARVVDEALGVDNSRSFIRAANAKRRDLPGHVRFQVADAASLKAETFHVVLAVNLICRLPRPRQFLAGLANLVVPGGQLVIATPYSWLPQYTPRRQWIKSGEIPKLLAPQFELKRRRDLPFLIREHARKFQFVVPEVLTFVRR